MGIPASNACLRYVDHIETEGAVQIGIEGVVGKRADSPYVAGRSKDWLKAKPAGHHDGWERPLRKQT
jgi:bifunctional non-homologous end joining protein LigD